MDKITGEFKVGRLIALDDLKCEVSRQGENLVFYIEGKLGEDVCSFDFITTCTKDELLKIKIGEKINFLDYIDCGDIVLGINDAYMIIEQINMFCTQFLENKFLLEISFKTDDNYVGSLELQFLVD